MNFDNYFSYRRVSAHNYSAYVLPEYIKRRLPNKNDLVVDFGCGYGQTAIAIKNLGYDNVIGVDINPDALAVCKEKGLVVHNGLDDHLSATLAGKASLIIASHVIEHFPKDVIISKLKSLKDMLCEGGSLMVMVPNAQSYTGAYWAYEDFTHHTLFTSGSLYYVLRAAGFKDVDFVDVNCFEGQKLWVKAVRSIFMWFYKKHICFWSIVTASSYHDGSEKIFSYEIKAMARG